MTSVDRLHYRTIKIPFFILYFFAVSIQVTGKVFLIHHSTFSFQPIITVSPISGTISSCSGLASSSPYIANFTVSGNGLSSGISATASAGFEISLSANGSFGGTLNLVATGNTISNTIIYVRSAASAAAGLNTGTVVLISQGAESQSVPISAQINPIPVITAIPNQMLFNNQASAPILFAATSNTYVWQGNTSAIGLANSGTGNIPSFNAVNNSAIPITDSITVNLVNAGFAYITSQNDKIVSVLNTSTNKVVQTIAVGHVPIGTVLSADGSTLYVANSYDNTISVINTATNLVTATFATMSFPTGLALSKDGSLLYVANQTSNTIEVISTGNYSQTIEIPVGQGPSGLVISPDGKKLYISFNNGDVGNSSYVGVFNTANNSIMNSIGLDETGAWGLALSPDGNTLYAGFNAGNIVSVINTNTNTVTTNINVGNMPSSVCLSPDGNTLYAGNYISNTISVINTATNTVTATISAPGPYGIAVTPDGKTLYAPSFYGNTVTAFNTSSLNLIDNITVGNNPGGIGNYITAGQGCSAKPAKFTITVCPPVTYLNKSATICGDQLYVLPSGKSINSTGTYLDTVHFNLTGCDSLITTLNLTVIPVAEIDTSIILCAGNTFTMPSGKTAGISGIYRDTVRTSLSGCDSLITVLNLTVLSVTKKDTSVILCGGQTYTLNSGRVLQKSGIYNDTIYYSISGCDSLITSINLTLLSAVQNDTTATICSGQYFTMPSGKSIQQGGVYNDTVYYTGYGCDSLVTHLVLNISKTLFTPVTVNASSQTICAGKNVTFTAMPGSGVSYKWLLDGKFYGNGNPIIGKQLENGDSIQCILIDTLPCAMPDTSTAVYIQVYANPDIQFNPDTVLISSGGITLMPIINEPISHYLWTPSTGLSPSDTVANPIANPLNTVIYQLQVTTNEGCTASKDLTVMNNLPLLLPNSFTPNGDGHNDLFRIPPGVSITLQLFEVFDRWGKMVFFTKDSSEGWDGNFQSIQQPVGTYVYFIKGSLLNGQLISIKGTVTLIR